MTSALTRSATPASATTAVARAAYALSMRAVLPAYALRLWWRGRAEPLYRARLAERFGCYRDAPSAGWVWVHAVSLGETLAARPLIEALRASRPGLRLLLTHGTATGRAAGAELLGAADRQTWLPFDTPGSVRRFLAHFRPAVGVLMETEIWPALLHEAACQGVPMVSANARLSAKSLRRGQRFAALLRPAVRSLTLALAQTEADAARLRSAGAPCVQVAGNLKFDLTPDPAQLAQGAAWRAQLGRPVVLAAITREGEEALLLDAWVRRTVAPKAPEAPEALLLIVPRHPQRFDEVAALVQRAGLVLARRSGWSSAPAAHALQAQVWLGDSMREMALYYAAADVALLGGSFAPLGGHNLIEAAACGCPLVMGPSTFNFAQAAALSLAAGASLQVADAAAAVRKAERLIAEPVHLQALRHAALGFAALHRGAALRMASGIGDVLPAAGGDEPGR